MIIPKSVVFNVTLKVSERMDVTFIRPSVCPAASKNVLTVYSVNYKLNAFEKLLVTSLEFGIYID